MRGELMNVPQNGDLLEVMPDGELVPATGQALQQVRTTYATAVRVQIERSIEKVTKRLMQEADLAGESFYYGWGAGRDRIEGPSVKLALALARCWGNCAVEALPVQDMGDSWIFTAAFVDLETGFTLQRQFRQSKAWVVHGKLDPERKADIRFQIGQSKAVRNVLLNALPISLVDRAIEQAKNGVRAKIEKYIATSGKAAAQDYIVTALGKNGVREESILARCKVASRAALELEDLVILRGDLSALQSGQERPEELFPPAEPKLEAPKAKPAPEPKAEAPAEPAPEPKPEPAAAPAPDLAARFEALTRGWSADARLGALRSVSRTGKTFGALTAAAQASLVQRLEIEAEAKQAEPEVEAPEAGDAHEG